MSAYVHLASSSVSQIVALVVWVLCLKCAALDLEPLEQVLGDAVLSALESARITVKEAVAIMAIDESQFRKALRGEGYRHISLNHLLKLPFSFWLAFSPTLMYLVAKKNMVEIAETVGLRRNA